MILLYRRPAFFFAALRDLPRKPRNSNPTHANKIIPEPSCNLVTVAKHYFATQRARNLQEWGMSGAC